MSKKRKDLSTSADHAGFGSALADALRDKGFQPSPVSEERVGERELSAIPSAGAADNLWSRCPRVRLRREKKGRKGKTVTVMEGLVALSRDERKQLARQVAKALGVGTSVEDEAVLVQGDLRERLAAWIEAQRR